MIRCATYLLLACAAAWIVPAAGQEADTALTISESAWREAKKDIDYTEVYRDRRQKFTVRRDMDLDLGALRYVFYGLVLAIIVVVLVHVLRNLKRNPVITAEAALLESVRTAEENPEEADLEGLMQEALAAGHFAIALRIAFLAVIRSLAERNLIARARDKTNWEYHGELKEQALRPPFGAIIRSFEEVWYGERRIDGAAFSRLRSQYEEFRKEVTSRE